MESRKEGTQQFTSRFTLSEDWLSCFWRDEFNPQGQQKMRFEFFQRPLSDPQKSNVFIAILSSLAFSDIGRN